MAGTTTGTQQAQQNVRQLAQQLQQLMQQSASVSDFFVEFLRLLTDALDASAGAVWLTQPTGELALAAQYRLSENESLQRALSDGAHQTVVREVLATAQAQWVAGDESAHTARSLATGGSGGVALLAPIDKDDQTVGVVGIFLEAAVSPEACNGFLKFVERMSAHASRFLTTREQQTAKTEQEFWHELAELSLQLQSTLKPKEVMTAAVNDGRLVLDCDRVSIALRRGRKVRVEAVSGSDAVNRRANLIEAMRTLVTEVLPLKETLAFHGNMDDLPPRLKGPLADFVAESGARTVLLIPLFEPPPLVAKKPGGGASPTAPSSEEARESGQKEPFGCLIIEQFRENAQAQETVSRGELLADHVAAALKNARAYHGIFLRPVLAGLGRVRDWALTRWGLSMLMLMAAVVSGLILIPWDYRVNAEGRLMPVRQRAVFAPIDGEIIELFVRGGQRVHKDDVLLRIRNDELHQELLAARSELIEKQEQQRAKRAQVDAAAETPDPEDDIRLQGELEEIQAQIRGLKSRVTMLAEREAALRVRAPISGIVSTFRIEKLLKRRPVQRGEVLLEVMDERGKWRLELEVEEHRMGHLLSAQAAAGGKPLPLEYVLATAPTETYRGRLQHIATRPKRVPDGGSLVEVFASLDEQPGPTASPSQPNQQTLQKRIGAEVRAKVSCGKRSLGYVLFGDVVEFVQSRFWL